MLLSKILLFSAEAVGDADIDTARDLVASIDEKDCLYMAFAIALNGMLWTGDLKLYKALRRKAFTNEVTTAEMDLIIKGI